ncbi:MAG: glutamine-hydrolyzing carbamoyl-phosphate synthase small subunit [Chitinophagaceae bacterium]
MDKQKQAILYLADGTYFMGTAYGATGTAGGEICFNTGMTGYQEVFTDPSYYGQVVIMNTAHIGNYGSRKTDVESTSVKISGLVAKNLSDTYSRPLADMSLYDYLVQNNIIAIHQIDTRALVAHIRRVGAMNCLISTEEFEPARLAEKINEVPSMEGLDLSGYVTTKSSYTLGNPQGIPVAVLDYGVKQNILQCLVERGCYLTVYPGHTDFNTIQSCNPKAYFISNGPGDPASMPQAIDLVKQIVDTGLPVFGICLGHQLIALAGGAKTFKMHHGHRGLNHPVLNLKTLKSEISTQNHGFSVDPESVKALPSMEITHVNLNDQTLEGLRRTDKPVFSVQYHPEATPGPHDSRYLFDDFVALIKQ